jgi:flagellar basal-body rod protein FlgC
MTIPPIGFPAIPLPQSAQRPEAPRPMFSALAIASSGLSAQRVRMDVIAQNLANAETTSTPEGGPYRRKVVSLEATPPETVNLSTATGLATPAVPSIGGVPGMPLAGSMVGSTPIEMTNDAGGVRVASIGEDKSEGPMIYDPGSPNADKNGYVRMPNVNMSEELMDLMNARRLYEANATVFQVARAMLHKAIDI